MSLGKIDSSVPWMKSNAVYLLTQDYKSEDEGVQTIAATMAKIYNNSPKALASIATIQDIYTNNFFPEMKASWKAYPNQIGHKDWPGCFRCHDEKHKTTDGKKAIKAKECNTCHIILAQGTGDELDKLNPHGQEFKHPGGDYDIGCAECHSAGF